MRHRDDDQPADGAGVQHRRRPGQQAAPVVPDHDGLAFAERPDQGRHVAGERGQVVPPRRLVAGAVPAEVGRDHPETGVGEVGKLGTPGPPELRKAVQQQHERSAAGLRGVQPDPVGADVAVRPGAGQQDAGGVRAVVGGRHRDRHQTL
jgi:hypothetical protein